MSIELFLLIVDPENGCVVRERSLGMSDAARRAMKILGNPAEDCPHGEWWTGASPRDAMSILGNDWFDTRPTELVADATAFPPPRYCWLIGWV